MEIELEISSFFQYVSNPVLYLSPTLRLLRVNKSAEKLLGVAELDYLSSSYESFSKLFQQLPGVKFLKQALEQGSIVKERGWHIQQLTRKDGAPLGLILILDIAENKKLKIDEPSISSFHKVLEQLPCAIYWKNINGVYLGANEKMAEIAGFESSMDVIGRTDFDLPWKSAAKKLQKNDRVVVDSRSAETFYEAVFLGKSEGNKIYLSTKSPLFNLEKKVVGIIGVSLDVSNQPGASDKLPKSWEKIEAEDEEQFAQMAKEIMGGELNLTKSPIEHLKAIKNFYEDIIASMPGNVFWMDRNSLHLGCNNNVLKMLGMKSRDEYAGITYAEMAKVGGWTKGQIESFEQDDRKVLETGKPLLNQEEPPIQNVSGDPVYFLSNRVPIRDENNETIGVLGVSLDITDRKKAEFALQKAKDEADIALAKAEEANRAKSNFLAVMSHELRTPLNAILGLAQVLTDSRELPTEKVCEYGQTIRRSGKELLTLINDVLEYSRAEAGQLRLEQELVDVSDLVNGVREKLINKAQSKGLSISVNIDNTLPRNMITDGQRLRQILTNLVDNAIKYSREGEIALEVTGKLSVDSQHVDIDFYVRDTGIGIPQDQQATIFDEFTQVASKEAKQYARKHGGVGLGLSIVKRFVNQMAGRIDFQSEEHKGTTFHCHFTFPLPSDDREGVAKFKELAGMPVLFVDDDKKRREKWQRQLLSWGFRVSATDHQHAMQQLSDSYDRGRAFPIVIMSRKTDSEKMRELTKQMRQEPRFNDVLHVAVFQEKAKSPEVELKKLYAILLQNCRQPEDFVDPFLRAWRAHQQMSESEYEISLEGKRILLVEDNQLNQRVAKLLLADLKCGIDVADDGESALKKLNANTYDLVLMDVGLPDISGLEVTEKFRHQHPDDYLPIIALTAHALVEDKQRCFDAGMDDYAIKPLDAEKLKTTIRRWIKRRHQKQ